MDLKYKLLKKLEEAIAYCEALTNLKVEETNPKEVFRLESEIEKYHNDIALFREIIRRIYNE